jgi:hypothetical protein
MQRKIADIPGRIIVDASPLAEQLSLLSDNPFSVCDLLPGHPVHRAGEFLIVEGENNLSSKFREVRLRILPSAELVSRILRAAKIP